MKITAIKQKVQKGQALITLLFFVIIAVTVTTGAAIVVLTNTLNETRLQQSTIAYEVAQSGAENAILRLLRDPTYTGETLTVGSGTATITVTGSGSTYTITSKGQVGTYIRTIQVTASYVNNILTATAEQEIF
jgi:type II secretory pathway component PulK